MLVRFTPRQITKLKEFLKTVKLCAYDIDLYQEITSAVSHPIDEQQPQKTVYREENKNRQIIENTLCNTRVGGILNDGNRSYEEIKMPKKELEKTRDEIDRYLNSKVEVENIYDAPKNEISEHEQHYDDQKTWGSAFKKSVGVELPPRKVKSREPIKED